jgi:hypothetical protein
MSAAHSAFRHARPDWLACLPVLIAGGRQPNKHLFLRQNRITNSVIRVSVTIQK